MIDYGKIAESTHHYTKHHYVRIEAPWWVSQEITRITKPEESWNEYFIDENKKSLVASGEQSFLYMAIKAVPKTIGFHGVSGNLKKKVAQHKR